MAALSLNIEKKHVVKTLEWVQEQRTLGKPAPAHRSENSATLMPLCLSIGSFILFMIFFPGLPTLGACLISHFGEIAG